MEHYPTEAEFDAKKNKLKHILDWERRKRKKNLLLAAAEKSEEEESGASPTEN